MLIPLQAFKTATRALSEEGGDEEAEVAASKADRVALPEKTRTGRRVAMPTRCFPETLNPNPAPTSLALGECPCFRSPRSGPITAVQVRDRA